MSAPSVCAVLLTADRPEMTRQAVECFRAQTYDNKRLLIWDTSSYDAPTDVYNGLAEREYFIAAHERLVIGQLRNRANSHATTGEAFAVPDILIHWDSDDYSRPNRIAEQVALLQSSGADVVGYNEMIFAREMVKRELKEETAFDEIQQYGPAEKFQQAWLYSNPNPHYALGTSLCYWRHVWERKPFEATSIGEDERFLRGLKVAAVSSRVTPMPSEGDGIVSAQPRMICRIHAGNTSTAYSPRKMESEARKKNPMWRRVPEWDSYCAETMK